ncbi:hypothetical protein L3Q67_30635 [Saccharothrix sp. AJ9571]|nr:hypothetical protein L3Q67_30635 [Saccharothrix sp. AJ9571]
MKRARTAPLIAAGCAALALTACGSRAGDTADGHTSPGIRLKFGERAVFPADYNKERFGTIAVTPYYLKFSVEYVKGDDLAGLPVSLRGILADGKSGGMALIGGTATCDSVNAPWDGFKTPGQKFDTCVLYGAKDGGAIAMAAFNDGDEYRKKPVLWGN